MDERWFSHAVKYIDDGRVCLSLADNILGEIGDAEGRPGFGSSRHNVGLWLLGFAVELAYKAVVAANGEEPTASHSLATIASRTARPLRRRIEKQLNRKLRLPQRGLSILQLWNYVDDEISYESRRYWSVSPRGSVFSPTHFGHLSRADDNYSIVASDVYDAADALLKLAEQSIRAAGKDSREHIILSWTTDSIASGFQQAPTKTVHPTGEVEGAVAFDASDHVKNRNRFAGTCAVVGCSGKPTDTLHIRTPKARLVLPLCANHGNPNDPDTVSTV